MAEGLPIQTMTLSGLPRQVGGVDPRQTGVWRRVLCGTLLVLSTATGYAQSLDQMPLDRWKKLREVERYQLNIAERYYKEQKWSQP